MRIVSLTLVIAGLVSIVPAPVSTVHSAEKHYVTSDDAGVIFIDDIPDEDDEPKEDEIPWAR